MPEYPPDVTADARPGDCASNRTSPPAARRRRKACRRERRSNIDRCRFYLGQYGHGRYRRHAAARPLTHGPPPGEGSARAPRRPIPRRPPWSTARSARLPGVALGLTVQRLVLAELLEHDHRQQARSRPSPCDGMEGRGRLRDLLAIAARELLAHRLDHLPLTGCDSSVRVTSSPSLRSRWPPQHAHAVGGAITTRSRGRWSGNVLRSGRLRVNRATFVDLATAFSAASSSSVALAFQLFERQRQLIGQALRALRPLSVNLALHLRSQLLPRDQRQSSDALARATANSAATSRAFARSTSNAAFRRRFAGRASATGSMRRSES